MKRSELQSMFGTERPILGMIHLPPLPGSPNYGGSMTAVIDHTAQGYAAFVNFPCFFHHIKNSFRTGQRRQQEIYLLSKLVKRHRTLSDIDKI